MHRCSTNSNCLPLSGWNGCVIHIRRSSWLGMGAIEGTLKDMAGERLLLYDGLNLCTKSIEAPAHIGHAGSKPDPGPCGKMDHLRRLSRTQRNSAGSAPASAVMFALPGNSTWMAPPLHVRSPADSSVGSGMASIAAEIATGSNAVALPATSPNWPLSNKRRHLKTWFAFTPCTRAISATLAPGSIVNRTIATFSETDRRLLTRSPETPSSA